MPRIGVALAAADELETICGWLNREEIARALDLRPPCSVEGLSEGLVPVYTSNGSPEWDEVDVLALRQEDQGDAAGAPRPPRGRLIGVALDYGWETIDDPIRELDFAVMESASTFATLEAMTRLADWLFCYKRAVEIRTHTRPGPSSRGFARLYAFLGAKEIDRPESVDPHKKRILRRVLYAVSPAAFYGSRAAKKYGCTRPG